MLVASADYLVKCSVKLARMFALSTFFVGLILVAMGTSLPEATVSILAVLKGENALALGNVVGSNIVNIGLVLGICGILNPLTIPQTLFKREIPFMLGATMALIVFSLNGIISRIEGMFLICFFIIFVYTSLKTSAQGHEENEFELKGILAETKSKSLVFFLFSFSAAVLIAGANLMVSAGINIADMLGVSPWIVAVTIFAIGTSLPELAASVSASLKKVSAISVGNVIGSNIFNIVFVIGIVALIRPIEVSKSIIAFDLPILAAFTVMFYVFMRTRFKLTRIESAFMLLGYAGFIIALIIK